MTAADHIKFSDDGTEAWLEDDRGFDAHALARTCDTCEGTGLIDRHISGDECPDCHGSGRHCFDITVECSGDDCQVMLPVENASEWVHTLTVSVVPGMVLPSAAEPGMWAVKLTVHATNQTDTPGGTPPSPTTTQRDITQSDNPARPDPTTTNLTQSERR